jgi:hypothetical protein
MSHVHGSGGSISRTLFSQASRDTKKKQLVTTIKG